MKNPAENSSLQPETSPLTQNTFTGTTPVHAQYPLAVNADLHVQSSMYEPFKVYQIVWAVCTTVYTCFVV
jgi:hypothetical protein